MMEESSTSSTPSSKVQVVLENAQKDVQNAEWSDTLLGPVASPIRDHVVSPVLDVATNVIPTVASHVPLLDGFSAFVLGVTFQAVKVGYKVLPHTPAINEGAERQLVDGAVQAKEHAVEEQLKEFANDAAIKRIMAVPGAIASIALAGIGYTVNATIEAVTAPEQKLREWKKSSDIFIGYLVQYGIDEEATKAFLGPRSLTNVIITSRIQNQLDSVTDHRHQAVLDVPPPLSPKETKALEKKASRYMKYSIAAYGVFMIESTEEAKKLVSKKPPAPEETSPLQVNGGILKEEDILEARLERIAKYLDIDKKDIVFATPPGGDLKLVGHFVAIDHQTRSVVVAIRGTHNTSEWVADFDATAVPFCGGLAHKGIAERAQNLCEHRDTRNAIVRALYDNEGYGFVFTGQSLGAGVANLCNIKVHLSGNTLFNSLKSVCFAYASPPVFAKPSASNQKDLRKAFAASYNYILGRDVVPFCSVDSVRRLAATLNEVDSLTSNMSVVDRAMLLRGAKEPSDALVEIVKQGSRDLEAKPGAERLKIPGDFIVWFKLISEDPILYESVYCDPAKVSDLCIFLDINMGTDHAPMVYEVALEKICGDA